MGVYGFIFSDFGKGFSVRDLNGEAPVSRIVTNVRGRKYQGLYFVYLLCACLCVVSPADGGI